MQIVNINTMGPSPIVERFIVTCKDFTTAGLVQTISLKAIPKGSLICGARILVAEVVAGASIATATLSLGTTGGSVTGVLAAQNVFTGVTAGTTQYTTSTLGLYSATYAADTFTCTITTTTSNVNLATTGKLYIDLVYIPFEELTATAPVGNTPATGGYL